MEIKSGQKFKALINNIDVEGKISIEDDVLYLCQDSEDGDSCTNKYGYKYSWSYDDQVSSFQLYDTKLRKWVLIEEITLGKEFKMFGYKSTMFGYKSTIFGNTVKFGCGSVSFTKDEMLDYIEIHKIAKKNPGYSKVLKALIDQQEEMDDKSFSTFQKIAKKMK
jgi:hypothetical protein